MGDKGSGTGDPDGRPDEASEVLEAEEPKSGEPPESSGFVRIGFSRAEDAAATDWATGLEYSGGNSASAAADKTWSRFEMQPL